jgi:hypothetical protein
MFARNVGGIDRILRIVIGSALVLGFILNPDGAYRWLYLIGLIPLLTGIFGTCAIYSLIGVNTCKVK